MDMDEDVAALQGADILSLALGRSPGASDLDEYVDIQVFFDGTCRAVQAGEAAPFLRAKLCQAFKLLPTFGLDQYHWHRDRFILEVNLGESDDGEEPHLAGHLRTGDGAEDEWFIVHLLQKWSTTQPDLACRITDNDGELLLIEAALAAPRWLTPVNAENRCWLRRGLVHLLPRPLPPEPQRLARKDALARLRTGEDCLAAKEKVQRAIRNRLDGYPQRAVEQSRHVVRAALPNREAALLLAYPQLVAVALDHLPPPPPSEILRLRRQLAHGERDLRLDCSSQSDEETTCIGVRLTRCQYARLSGLHISLPQLFTEKHWRAPKGSANISKKSIRFGAMLCLGLEVAYLQGSNSATAALRWPSPQAHALLPTSLPWLADMAFAKHIAELQPGLDAPCSATQRAFCQQADLDEPFRRAFAGALDDPRLLQIVDLAAHWCDHDDNEEWLHISPEELDQEMQARQAEYDAFDKKCHVRLHKAGGPEASETQEELAAMGSRLSGLLAEASSVDGLETNRSSTTAPDSEQKGEGSKVGSGTRPPESDSSESVANCGELDVLGMESDDAEGASGDEVDSDDAEASGAGFREYLSELDEQLATELDGHPGVQEEQPGSFSLSSKHVKVHGAAGFDLDVHAMQHVLASFCEEAHSEPGPASLLLQEMGLAGAGAARGGRIGQPVLQDASLNTMD